MKILKKIIKKRNERILIKKYDFVRCKKCNNLMDSSDNYCGKCGKPK